MFNVATQQRKAKEFRDLHFSKSLLILPNIWDPLGAAMLEDIGYPAIATASASIAYTHGFQDGEHIRFDDLLKLLTSISGSVKIPVTADMESGYADSDETLMENIRQVIEAGIVGINFEDYDLRGRQLFPIDIQCKKIELIRKVADAMNIPLFINARCDVYIKGAQWVSREEKWQETCKRGIAYLQAGADGFYPITMNDGLEIKRLMAALPGPVNILAGPGVPDLNELQEMGVARLSLGPGFLKVAIRAMKQAALQLKNHEGFSSVTENEISSDYLRKLVS